MTISPGNKIARALPGFEFGCTEKGTDYVALTFSIIDGPEASESMSWRGYFTERTEERTIESLRICGWGGDDILNLDGLDRNVVQLVVENETYEGKTRPKIKWVNAIRSGVKEGDEMDPGKKAAFAARLRGVVASVPASKANEGRRYTPADGAGGPPSGRSEEDPGPKDEDLF